jgi:hypothetical protein
MMPATSISRQCSPTRLARSRQFRNSLPAPTVLADHVVRAGEQPPEVGLDDRIAEDAEKGIGRPATGSSAFGLVSVRGRRRVPTPAAGMTAFMWD